eukprot:824366_1
MKMGLCYYKNHTLIVLDFFNNKTECEDVKDIVIAIEQHQHQYPIDQDIIIADIGSMYDNIPFTSVKEALRMAIDMMPPGLITGELYNLWIESMDYLEFHLIFEYKDELFRILNSQVQGTPSGGDNATFVVCLREIQQWNTIEETFALYCRYKDDILAIPHKTHTKDEVNMVLQSIYFKYNFEFDIEIESGSAIICDIQIYIDNDGNLRTRYGDTGKIRRYILKSSDIKQCINGIFKTLCGRYIVINDDIKSYNDTKKLICKNLMASGWIIMTFAAVLISIIHLGQI